MTMLLNYLFSLHHLSISSLDSIDYYSFGDIVCPRRHPVRHLSGGLSHQCGRSLCWPRHSKLCFFPFDFVSLAETGMFSMMIWQFGKFQGQGGC